ncbi:hypothetical protein EYC98_16645 [Halieaceae bacterium IMCC14734]|uniref:Bacterial repeat domain-containing protein n=1 Tax=Candidatus Litorirhabdus singularis TaxID=2518993 RepID=A0ABT3TJJ6_9GAMM|nr:hypothetical protein [Candidatus Litorirhabdus singularis]MCX2982493.1 hypothetical protein [Candidatus Litorirhabdus singularis]
MKLLKSLCLFSAASLLSGCYLEAFVGSGGEIKSLSGTRDCEVNSVCLFEVTDTNFNESFVAMPKPGYVFSKWKAGSGYLCGDDTNPICTANNTGYVGNPSADAIIASDYRYHIIPIFELAETSGTDAVVVDATGKVIGIPAAGLQEGQAGYGGEMTVYMTFDGLEGAHLAVLDTHEERVKQYERFIPAFYSDFGCDAPFIVMDAPQNEPAYAIATARQQFYAVDLSAEPVEYTRRTRWDDAAESCQTLGQTLLSTGLPMVPVEIDITWPIRVELR